MIVRTFTGPTELTKKQQYWVARQMMSGLGSPNDVWRSGCAFGVDTIAAHLAAAAGMELELYVPAAFCNYELIEHLEITSKVIKCPAMSTAAASYRARNNAMVKGSDHLLAFVWKEEFYRSGEWMTINIAHRTKTSVKIVTLPQTSKEQS